MVEKFNMTRYELQASLNMLEKQNAELLEALKAALDVVHEKDIYMKMEQAIAKAEGDNNG